MGKNYVLPEVLVACVTGRGLDYLPNVVNNFKRQKYDNKRLFVVINSNSMSKVDVENYLRENGESLSIVASLPGLSLGACLNHTIDHMPATALIWAKMDDDDFYGENYLLINVRPMLEKKADIVGRRDLYMYIPEWKKAYFRKNGGRNGWVPWVQGASLTVQKHVFSKVRFPNINKGEDTTFGHAARTAGFRAYAASVEDFVVIRHVSNDFHTWKIDLKKYLKFGTESKAFPIQRLQQEHVLFPTAQTQQNVGTSSKT